MDSNNMTAGTPGEQNNSNAMPGVAASEAMVSETAAGATPGEAAAEMQAAMVAEQIANPVEPPKENIMAEGNANKKKSGKGMMIAVVFLALVALGGIGFGVWMMIDSNNQTKTLNNQISDLRKTNSELLDKLAEREEEPVVEENVVVSQYENPVIKSNESDTRYSVSLEAGSADKRIRINVMDGAVDSCDVYTNGSLASKCEISGISGKIYNVINFGEGQALDENNGIGFIMTDGTVEYIPLIQAMENDDYSIKGKLNIDGYVVNAFGIGVSFEISEGAYGGYGSTVFVLRDGNFVKFDKSMLD